MAWRFAILGSLIGAFLLIAVPTSEIARADSNSDQIKATMDALNKALAQKADLATKQATVQAHGKEITDQYQVKVGALNTQANDLAGQAQVVQKKIQDHNDHPVDSTCAACVAQYNGEANSLNSQNDAIKGQLADLQTRFQQLQTDTSQQTVQWAADLKSVNAQMQDNEATIMGLQQTLKQLQDACWKAAAPNSTASPESMHETCGQRFDLNGTHSPLVYQGTGTPFFSSEQKAARDKAAIQAYLDSGGVPTSGVKVWPKEPPPPPAQ